MTTNDTGNPPIVVVIDGPELLLSCWPARALLKRLPGARWDRGRQAWVMPSVGLATVEYLLSGWPGGLTVTRDAPLPPRHSLSVSWADAMFAAVPDRLHKPAFRALSRVLHPDADGDHAAMSALSAARDRLVTS